jgi:hypothetical protein
MRYLIILLFPLSLFAETTSNLILNGTFENNNSNNWTTSGDVQVLGDCCGSNYDLEFGDSGSIEQSFVLISDDITQPMLNNGITLNSSVQVQNGECGVSGCWGGSGPADTFTIRLQIRDSDSNVLATTTQERTNVTGINGKDFTDSVSYTGIGSNIGNIFLSGSDGNSPANLGGPNLDNISVTMTYDPTVLSSTQTSHITTTFQEIEEVLFSKVERVEFIPIEEFTFEVYEEPVVQMFEEIYIEEIAKEEINIGTVNVFKEIPMEVTYEEPKTIETFATEIESYKETEESFNQPEERETILETSNSSGVIERESPPEETSRGNETTNVVEEKTGRENESTSGSSEERIVGESNGENNEQNQSVERDTDSQETASNNESRTLREESNTNTDELVTENDRQDTPNVSIESITKQVERTTMSINQKLEQINILVAKAMQSPVSIDSYTTINDNIFNEQLKIDGGNLDEYIQRDYTDSIQISDGDQSLFNDIVVQNQIKIDNAKANVVRSQEHLRRIRGY